MLSPSPKIEQHGSAATAVALDVAKPNCSAAILRERDSTRQVTSQSILKVVSIAGIFTGTSTSTSTS